MEKSYDDRDGFIWLDGEIIPWRNAQIHILTLYMIYVKSDAPVWGINLIPTLFYRILTFLVFRVMHHIYSICKKPGEYG